MLVRMAKSLLGMMFACLLLQISPSPAQETGQNPEEPWLVLLEGVDELSQRDDDVIVLANGRWYRLYFDGDILKREEIADPSQGVGESSRMPDGFIALREVGSGLTSAWYGDPTTRYEHGALGDSLEAQSLVALDSEGNRHKVELPLDQVFEDRTPRLADLDGDGELEIVTIRTNIIWGSQVVVYGLKEGELTHLAHSDPLGQAYRWLNIAGVVDFDGDGTMEIAAVEKPHIEGRLVVWTYRSGRLMKLAEKTGYSNHKLGLPAMDLSAVVDKPGERPYLLLPNFTRDRLEAVTLDGQELKTLGTQALPDKIETGVACLRGPRGTMLLVGVEGGRLMMRYDKDIR